MASEEQARPPCPAGGKVEFEDQRARSSLAEFAQAVSDGCRDLVCHAAVLRSIRLEGDITQIGQLGGGQRLATLVRELADAYEVRAIVTLRPPSIEVVLWMASPDHVPGESGFAPKWGSPLSGRARRPQGDGRNEVSPA